MRPGRRVVLLLVAAAVVAATGVSCVPAYRGEAIHGPLGATDPQVVRGQAVFDRFCHQCHPGASAGLGPSVILSPTLIRFQVRNGLGAMPAFDETEISDEDLEAIVAYLMKVREHGVRLGIR